MVLVVYSSACAIFITMLSLVAELSLLELVNFTRSLLSRALRSVYTERKRERESEHGFSSWNILVICRGTVQKECEREQIFVRANNRLDCPQSEFSEKAARLFLLSTSQHILPLHHFHK